MFWCCSKLTSLDLSGWDVSKVIHMNEMFEGCSALNHIICKIAFRDWCWANADKIVLPKAMMKGGTGIWSLVDEYDESTIEPISLSVDAPESISWRQTNIPLTVTYKFSAYAPYYDEVREFVETFTDTSESFDQNDDYENDKEISLTYSFHGFTVHISTIQTRKARYIVDLNSNWRLQDPNTNPDSTSYDGTYESYAHTGVNSSGDLMKITISGYDAFKLYIRSYAESTYDYVMVSQLDKDITYNSSGSDLIKATTSGKQNPSTSIGGYTLVEFTNIDGGEHVINVIYRKDSSTSKGDDRGYVLIPKNQ